MIKMKKSFVSMIMAMVMMVAFCVPSFATTTEVETDDTTATFQAEDGQIKVTMTEKADENPSLRYPGTSGLYGVKVHPAIMATKQYAPNSYTYELGNGRTQYLHVTLDPLNRDTFDRVGADSFMAAIDINFATATRYEVTLNGEYVGGGSCAGFTRGNIEVMLYDERPAIWEVTLYDNTTQGKTLWGHIYYN